VLDTKRRDLKRGSEPIAIGPQVFDLLVYLVQNREHVVTKDDLLEVIWSGRTVSESTLTSHINFARKAIGDNGEKQKLIRTVARKGFRFVGDVTERKPSDAERASASVPTPSNRAQQAPALALPDKPSIAVLPFDNLSGDPEQDYFADGVAEDIITALSRMRWLFVIARNSSFSYKGRAVDVRHVGRDLGVRYVLEGSLRRSAGRVRVVAQLIDAESGNHIWAERYDRGVEDVFAVQDEVTAAIVTAIQPAVADVEAKRAQRKPPERLSAWEAYQRGLWHYGKKTVADHEQAKQFFQRAIAMDAGFPAPYVGLAQACLDDAADYGSRSIEDAAKLSASWAQKAIAIDPEDADARAAVALLALTVGKADEAHDQASLARASNPNSPMAVLAEANSFLFTGRPGEARQGFIACLRIDPRGPLSG